MRIKFPVLCIPVVLMVAMHFILGGMWLNAAEVTAVLLCMSVFFIAINSPSEKCEKLGLTWYFILSAVVFLVAIFK